MKIGRPIIIATACALLLALVAVLIAGGAIRKALSSLLTPHGPVQVGESLPRMTLESLDGSPVTIALAPGHVTFVNVFATWCPPCRAETPDLAAFAATEVGKGVDVVGIDQQESPAAVDAFRAQFHTLYPMVIDTGWETKDALGARVIPRTIVVDGKGIVRAVFSGPMTRDQMDQLAAEAAANS
jgi:cytochrome c biogenesis protein CcmG/thiol:disulfide interchange protein DsbE